MTLDCFEHRMWHHCIKIEFQKITNFLNTAPDEKDLPRFVIKKKIEVYDQSEIKTSMPRSDLYDYSDA